VTAIANELHHANMRDARGTTEIVNTCGMNNESLCPLVATVRLQLADHLHDSVVQELFALSLGLESLSKQALNLVGTIREEIFGLCITSGLSLRAEIELAVKTFSFFTLIEIRQVDAVPFAHQGTVRDVVKESVSNAVRHGKANRVTVDVSISTGDIEVHVVDDGRGCAPIVGSTGGLEGMARRAQACGGSFAFTANTTGGMSVQWKIPNKEEKDD